MKIESHLENLRESIRNIAQSITEGIEENQRTIGFHVSAAADMLEVILHKNNLIGPGFMVKHEWFNSKNTINEKFNFEFPKKKEILEIIMAIEPSRNPLCYGRRRKKEEILPIIESFNKLKDIFQEETKYEL